MPSRFGFDTTRRDKEWSEMRERAARADAEIRQKRALLERSRELFDRYDPIVQDVLRDLIAVEQSDDGVVGRCNEHLLWWSMGTHYRDQPAGEELWSSHLDVFIWVFIWGDRMPPLVVVERPRSQDRSPVWPGHIEQLPGILGKATGLPTKLVDHPKGRTAPGKRL
jgi:hypothetical protein